MENHTFVEMSVVIVTYHRIPELIKAIQSCICFIDMKCEYIIIDNGCDDECRQAVNGIKEKENLQLEYVSCGKNIGVSKARNLGMHIAKMPLVYFLDDDARIVNVETSFSQIIKEVFKKDEVAVVTMPVYNESYDVWMIPRKNKMNKQQVLSFNGASHIMYKERIVENRLYPECLFYGHEDLSYSLDVFSIGRWIWLADEITVHHSQSGPRDYYKEERFLAIGNKFAIKSVHFPRKYQCILRKSFLSRCFRFWRWNLYEICRCIAYAYKTKNKLKRTVNELSEETANHLLEMYGADFLTEISNSGTDKKPERKR